MLRNSSIFPSGLQRGDDTPVDSEVTLMASPPDTRSMTYAWLTSSPSRLAVKTSL